MPDNKKEPSEPTTTVDPSTTSAGSLADTPNDPVLMTDDPTVPTGNTIHVTEEGTTKFISPTGDELEQHHYAPKEPTEPPVEPPVDPPVDPEVEPPPEEDSGDSPTQHPDNMPGKPTSPEPKSPLGGSTSKDRK